MKNKIISKITSCTLLLTMFAYTNPIFTYAKNETVYSKQNSNGNIYKTIITTQMEDNSYNQEESEKDLPVDCTIKYELDGKEIDIKDIIGKSGKVKIILEYTNKDSHIIDNETLYTPFLVICGTTFDNQNNKNIEITNGKILDNGNKTIVVGMCLPGMNDNLTLNIPNSIEITMDTSNFELNNIMTYVTPKALEDIDESLFTKLDNLYSQISKLQSSSKQIEDGALSLKDGISTYNEKSQEFNSALNQIATGVNTIDSNYNKLNDGISSLAAGSSNLQNGATALNSGIDELTSALNILPDSILALYNGSSQVLNNFATLSDGVNSIISSLETTITTLKDTLSKSSAGSDNSIKILKSNNTSLQIAINALDPINNSTTIEQLQKQIAANEYAISSYEDAKMAAEQSKLYIEQIEKSSQPSIKKLKSGISVLHSSITQINTGLSNLNTATKSLPANLETLSNGSKSLANGSKSLATGTSTLSSSSNALKSGIHLLNENTEKLANANSQLNDGASTILTGATTLSTGITKFNNDGISPIHNYINIKLKNITDKIINLQDLSKAYNNNEDIKFIIVTDNIKSEFISEDNDKEN